MKYDPKIIEDKYKTLPADVQLAMASTDVSKIILEIANNHELFLDQANELSDEVSYVMLGLTKSKDFVKTISKSLDIDEKKAIEIAQDINKEVFDKMRQSLQKIEAGHDEGYSEESGNAMPVPVPPYKKSLAGQGEQTMMTDAEKATQHSVIDAVERAGGFVIDRPDPAPLQAEEMVHDALRENLESRKKIINVLEKDNLVPPAKTPPPMPLAPDHLLGDTPEPAQKATTPRAPFEQEAGHDSIVETLLSKGVAMPMDSGASKPASPAQPSPKPETKARPYDGTDPYREALS